MHFDEEKFTAYALGELASTEVGPVEARLGYDEAARQFVADVRAAAELLTQSLQHETDQTLTAGQHAVIERQLRANRAASTGLPAADFIASGLLDELDEFAAAIVASGSEPAIGGSSSDPLAGAPHAHPVNAPLHTQLNSPSTSTSHLQGQPHAAGSRAHRRDSVFALRARRYDRAVLALSLAASVSIVCLGLAALLLALKDRRQVAVVAPSDHRGTNPYYLQGVTPPPEQREQGTSIQEQQQSSTASAARLPAPTTDDVAPWLSQIANHSPAPAPLGEPVASNSSQLPTGLLPRVVEQPAVDLSTGPVTSIHLSRAGLVRGPADMPRAVASATPQSQPPSAVSSNSSINPAHGAPLTPTIPLSRIDRALDLTRFEEFTENPLVRVAAQPFSSFVPNPDSTSYAMTRRFLVHGYFPPPQVVRVEELLNYFTWHTPAPTNPDAAFATSIEVAACPWNVEHRLARISLRSREIPPAHRPPVNLVVLVDLSGPMQADNKLPLLKKSLKLLLGQLGSRDRLSIVGASENAWKFLPPTSGDNHRTILDAIDRLSAAGPVGKAPGIEAAYYAAAGGFVPGGINRVLLATDGSWSAALPDQTSVTRIIEDKARTQNISLGVLAMGGAPANIDASLRRLAAAGNGSFLAIDNASEAHRILVDQADGSLVEVARDVSVRVEFEPATAESYRLIGYESHLLPASDFDDAVVGGASIGAGHDTTALYEIVPTAASRMAGAPATPLLMVSVHYTDAMTQSPSLLKFAASDRPVTPSKVSNDFKFAAAVAEFAMLLRESPYGNATWASALDLAQQGRGPDESGYRQEFIELARRAKAIAAKAN